MKKVLVSVLIFLILTNFIFYNNSYAVQNNEDENNQNNYSQQDVEKAIQEGNADITVNGEKQTVSLNDYGISAVGTIVGILSKNITYFPMIAQLLVTSLLRSGWIIKENEIRNINSRFIRF